MQQKQYHKTLLMAGGGCNSSLFAAGPVLQDYIIYLRLAVHPKQFCFNPRALPKLIAEQHHQPYVGWTSKLQIMSLCVPKYTTPRSRGARWGVGVARGGGGRRDGAGTHTVET